MEFKKPSKIILKPLLLALAVLFTFMACSENPSTSPDAIISNNEVESQANLATQSNHNVVEIIAKHEGDDYIFELSETEIPSGWTTFRLKNESHSTHFAYLPRIPQGAIDGAAEDGAELLDYWVEHITNPFQFFMDVMLPGKEPRGSDLSDKYTGDVEEGEIFPPWFGALSSHGGPGFTAGMTTSETTIYLEEGEYIVECYVKNAEGDFHSYLGMIEHLTVSDENGSGEQEPPAYTSEVTVSTNGIDFDRHISAGEHTFKVTFEDQTLYDHLIGHDVHLIRMDTGTSVEEVGKWMSWMDPDGLVSSSSANSLGPATFLGGVQTMTAGSSGYFHVELEPGRYAWVSEIPDPHSNQMLEVFNVPKGEGIGRGYTGRR